MKPNRSDALLSPDESAKIEQQTRQYFDSIAPKRHPKPSRSDYSSSNDISNSNSDQDSIPELKKLRDLNSDPQKLDIEGGGKVLEEYVETEYYKDLNCIDKQHHTTGTGFIRVEKLADVSSNFDLNQVANSVDYDYRSPSNSYKGNPATNDWIPSADPVIPVSNKPSRSEA